MNTSKDSPIDLSSGSSFIGSVIPLPLPPSSFNKAPLSSILNIINLFT